LSYFTIQKENIEYTLSKHEKQLACDMFLFLR